MILLDDNDGAEKMVRSIEFSIINEGIKRPPVDFDIHLKKNADSALQQEQALNPGFSSGMKRFTGADKSVKSTCTQRFTGAD